MKHKSLWRERAQQCQKIEIQHDMVKNFNWHDWGKLLLIEASKFQTYLLFNHMWTLKFNGWQTNAFFAVVNQMSGGTPPSLWLLPSTVLSSELCTTTDLITALGSSQKLGVAAEHLIDGSEISICWSSFEFLSQHNIERRSNYNYYVICLQVLYIRTFTNFFYVLKGNLIFSSLKKTITK